MGRQYLLLKRERVMSVSTELDFELDNLPIDVFDLSDTGLTVNLLTQGHGMSEVAASCSAAPYPCSSQTH
jgi:hypothetical protein